MKTRGGSEKGQRREKKNLPKKLESKKEIKENQRGREGREIRHQKDPLPGGKKERRGGKILIKRGENAIKKSPERNPRRIKPSQTGG